MALKASALLICLLFASSVFLSRASPIGHKCTHDDGNHPKPEVLDVDEAFPAPKGRNLASYSNIRMKAYYGAITDATYLDYIQNDLIPPILSYFTSALQVKYPIASTIKLSSSQATVCGGITMPKELTTGVATDFYYILAVQDDEVNNWWASSYACYLSSGSKRPYIAKTTFNSALVNLPNGDVLLHEMNMVATMHEITHTLGFSQDLYPYFLDSDGNTLTGHIKSATFEGVSTVVLDVSPLTTKLRTYFGCSTLAGAYMENTGGDGTYGSHFERRVFGYEAMTTPMMYQEQYSQFSLALLEGSGWYVANYSMADNFFFGQGNGCGYFTQSCSSSGFSYDEFCTGSSQGCTNVGRGGGSCSADMRSDSCKFVHPNINYDCENTDTATTARLPTLQVFGRGQNSKCFTGNISATTNTDTTTSFCFKYTCSGSGSSTVLTVKVGSASLACNKEGTAKITVNGHPGVVNCPDPLTFCSTVGLASCPRGCMGRGTCKSGVCVCKTGYTGTDCALTA